MRKKRKARKPPRFLKWELGEMLDALETTAGAVGHALRDETDARERAAMRRYLRRLNKLMGKLARGLE